MANKIPMLLRVVRVFYPLTEILAPFIARKWALHLFLTPVKAKFIPGELDFLSNVERFYFDVGDRKLAGYQLGKGPVVICIHGWAGRGAQFRYIAEALVKHGYTFAAFDAVAHGQSEGYSTQMFEFKEALLEFASRYDNIRAVIGHSLGAATISFAISEGHTFPRFVSLGAPVIAEDILDSFASIINGSDSTKKAIRAGTLSRVNRSFNELTMQETFKKVRCPVLAIHGIDDADVPHRHLDTLLEINPEIRAIKVPDVGHRRMLKSSIVIDEILQFIGDT